MLGEQSAHYPRRQRDSRQEAPLILHLPQKHEELKIERKQKAGCSVMRWERSARRADPSTEALDSSTKPS